MSRIPARIFALTVFLTALALGQPQSLFIPQVADGGNWQTTIVLTNTTTSPIGASLAFFQDTTGGATQSWNLSLIEAVAQSVQVPGGATVFLHTPGTGAVTSVGWGQVTAAVGVSAYAIFTQRVPGRTDQDGTAPGGPVAGRVLVPFDNTAGSTTSVAIVNPTTASQTVSLSIKTETGAVSQSSISLPAQGHMAFALADQLPATSGQRGLAEFYTSTPRGEGTGSLSMLALRFNSTGAFTTAPVFGQSGPHIVGVAPPSTGGK
jgi:hypothetical protein